MNWQERIRDELLKPQREEEARQRKAREDATRRAEEIKRKTPEAIAILQTLGIREMLEGIRRDVWKAGQITDPRIIADPQDPGSVILNAEYELSFKYPTLKKEFSHTESSPPFIGVDLRYTSGNGVKKYKLVRTEGKKFITLGISIVPDNSGREFPFIVYCNSDVLIEYGDGRTSSFSRTIYPNNPKPVNYGSPKTYPDGFDFLGATKEAIENLLVGMCTKSTQTSTLPQDLQRKGEEWIRKDLGKIVGEDYRSSLIPKLL